MRHTAFLPLLFFVFIGNTQVTKVEHFYMSSPDAEKYFKLFKDELGLPVVWNYQEWTGFASGGLTLGNVAFEFASYDGVKDTKFEGIALEPKQTVQEFIVDLVRLGIPHDTINVNSMKSENGITVGWDNLDLAGVLPAEAGLFICDYKQREMVLNNRRKGIEALQAINGGPLGVIRLKEIVVTTNDHQKYQSSLAKLPGIQTRDHSIFMLTEGPAIRLNGADRNGIEKIVIEVRSVDVARQYLKSKNLLGEVSGDGVYIDSKSIGGLVMEIVEGE